MATLEQELMDMSANWKQTAREMIARSEVGSRSEMCNQMLMACAQMLEWKIVQQTKPTESAHLE